MKKIKHILRLPVLAICFFNNNLFAQQIPNGDFERWDSTLGGFPINWITEAHSIPYPLCPTSIDNTATKTSDRHSGNWAVELKTKSRCMKLGAGYMTLGDYDSELFSAIPYTYRPQQLNFYYKFLSIGNDTGFAKITLRLTDGSGKPGEIIGEGRVSITSDTNEYTLMTVSIEYFSPVKPELLQIVFSTSKKLSDREYPLAGGEPGDGLHEGTTLWIDDVTVSGGDVGIKKNEPQINWHLFPNPISDVATLSFNMPKTEIVKITLYSIEGKELLQLFNETAISNQTYNLEIDGTKLHSGVYIVKFQSHETISKKIIVLK